MRHFIYTTVLASCLSILFCASGVYAQPGRVIYVVVIDAEKKLPVEGAGVVFVCGAKGFFGTTDASGLAKLEDPPVNEKECWISMYHGAYETPAISSVATPKASGESIRHQVTIKRKGKVEIKGKAREINALDKKGCPEPLLMRYGLCVPPDRARVIDGLDRGIDCPKPKLIRFGGCVTVDKAREIDGAECARQGRNWRGVSPNNYCVSDAEIVAAEAADDAECARTLTGSHAGFIGEATWGCRCPPGYVPDAAGKECVQIKPTKTEPDSVFVGTWNGTGNAKGITLVINKDGTGVFTDTRPGQTPRPNGGKGKWVLDRPGFIVTDIGFGFWYRNGVLVDPWDNIYTK